jgi:hypothetical protein
MVPGIEPTARVHVVVGARVKCFAVADAAQDAEDVEDGGEAEEDRDVESGSF